MRFNGQTIIQIIAFLGAVGIAIYQQYKNDRRSVDDRRRKFVAARAALPMILAEINKYTNATIELLKEIYPPSGELTVQAGKMQMPPFPSSVIPDLRNLIEHSDDRIGNAVAFLIQFMQIHSSRLIGTFERTGISEVQEYEYANALYDTLFLSELTSRFYAFARSTSENIDTAIDSRSVHKAAEMFGVVGLEKRIEATFPKQANQPPPFFRRVPSRITAPPATPPSPPPADPVAGSR